MDVRFRAAATPLFGAAPLVTEVGGISSLALSMKRECPLEPGGRRAGGLRGPGRGITWS